MTLLLAAWSSSAHAQTRSAPSAVLGAPQPEYNGSDGYILSVRCSTITPEEYCLVRFDTQPAIVNAGSIVGSTAATARGLDKSATYYFSVQAVALKPNQGGPGPVSAVVKYKHGEAPVTLPPMAEWTDIGSQTAYVSISAGSASKLVGSSGAWPDGNNYLLSSAGANFEYHMLRGTTNKQAMVQSSISSDGTWWGVQADATVWRYTGSAWQKMPGALKQISVGGANNIWGVDAKNNVYKWSGSDWTAKTGALINVSSSGDGTVWGITPSSGVVKWNGDSWTAMPGVAIQVSVGSYANVYVVNAAGDVFKWTGTGWSKQKSAGKCKAVAAAFDGTVLVIRSSDSSVYRRQ